MKKLFVCLANSKKYSGRCIAGIELIKKETGYEVVSSQGAPRWIRPVSSQEHGEVAGNIVDHVSLLDVVELDIVNPIPQGYQSENHLFEHNTLTVVSSIEARSKSINNFLNNNIRTLFGNRGKAVPADSVDELDHSLVFIKPEEVEFRSDISYKGKDQVRATFLFSNNRYDLPVTDISFVSKYNQNPNVISECENIYFTLSLGLMHEGWHYKLIAGVIYF